jgi:hypothetical protein
MWETYSPELLSKISNADGLLYKNIVTDWENILNKAIADWQKFQTERVKFTQQQQQAVFDWYREFPRLWSAVRPNFELAPGETTASKKFRLLEKADAFVYGNRDKWVRGLGAPVLLIAGVVVSAVAGVAGVLWAIGFIRRQGNISSLIDKVAAGQIPTSVLTDAIRSDAQAVSPLADIGTIVKWGAIGLALFFVVPPLLATFKAGRSA